MEWLLAAVILICATLLIGYHKIAKAATLKVKNIQWLANQQSAENNVLVMSVFARELANELMQRDAEGYNQRLRKLYKKWKKIEKRSREEKLDHKQEIEIDYLFTSDFDTLRTKPHVLYADVFSGRGDDDLWELYESIRLSEALNCELDDTWKKHGTSITKSELKHLTEYCKQLSDTKLLAHLHKAREQYYFLDRSGVEVQKDTDWIYETDEYKICRVHCLMESRWGVYVKSMDRYGMWSLFNDDGIFYTYFMTADKNFNEQYLNALSIPVWLDHKEYSTFISEKIY